MASDKLLLFNEQFPDSKYREIYPQYVGPTNTDEEKQRYQKSKAPMNTKLLSFDEIKDTKNRVGWIVPKDYIVIDIDKKANARVVFDILQSLKIKFSFMTGKKGGHFIFKNHRHIKSISAGLYCSLGIVVDVRCNEKGYIVLPENDTDRSWGNISSDVDEVPFFLIPLPKLKTQTDFVGMGEGGRNDALLKHMLSLIDYAPELTIDEKAESIRIINSYLFEKPMSDVELSKTVLREDILKKEEEKKEEGSKTCFEEKLATRIIKDKQLITCGDDCYIYNGKYYQPFPDVELERLIHLEYAPAIKEKNRKETIKFIKLKSYVDTREVNKHWNEIVFKNGVLNLSNMTLNPHTPSVYNTVYVDYNYIPDAPYSQMVDEFFNHISSNDADKKSLLYEIVGYSLVRKQIFSKFFICYGEGQTGKSTYLSMIQNLVGNHNASFISLNDLEDEYMPSELYGKLVNIGDDIAYKGLKETDTLKKLVSGQMFAAQRKYKSPINFSNFAKLIFTTNRLPEVYDRSTGFYRRVMIIEINTKIEKPDPFFLDRLTDKDYEYLLSVAIERLVAALKVNALTECASSKVKLEEYRTDQSSVLSFMKDFGYKKSDLDHKPCTVIFKEYEQYCFDTGFKPMKKVNFDREICDEYKLVKKCTTYSSNNDTNQCWRFVNENNK